MGKCIIELDFDTGITSVNFVNPDGLPAAPLVLHECTLSMARMVLESEVDERGYIKRKPGHNETISITGRHKP